MSDIAMVELKASSDLSLINVDEATSVQEFMNKVFRKESAPAQPKAVPATEAAVESELLATNALIERASQTIEVLASRCSGLEAELQQSRNAVAEQTSLVNALKAFSTEMKQKIDALEGHLTSALSRCEAAETRVLSLEEQERSIALRARRAETISSTLQKQVELAFGVGSPIRSVMNSVSLQQAAE